MLIALFYLAFVHRKTNLQYRQAKTWGMVLPISIREVVIHQVHQELIQRAAVISTVAKPKRQYQTLKVLNGF